MPSEEVRAAVRLFADVSRPVVTVGGRFSDLLARCLGAHLQEVRPNARHLPDSPAERAAALLDIGRRDVVAAFDYRRYQRDTIRFGEAAKQQGATLVLFTDPWLSPLASIADVVLQASVAAPSPSARWCRAWRWWKRWSRCWSTGWVTCPGRGWRVTTRSPRT